VPGFESIVDQKRPIQILTTFLHGGCVPHALLFYGAPGVGKRTTAKLLAKACNCRERASGPNKTSVPCGACRSCEKIDSGSHPDVLHIKPSGSFIKIKQIRELLETLSLKPYEAETRVVIVSEAQALNPEAGNAMLKVLEEPPDDTIFILTTEQIFDLLPTVVSRCQQIRFSPISKANVKNVLVGKHTCDPDEADVIAAMAKGSISTAVKMSRSNWIRKRRWLIGEMKVLTASPMSELLAFAETMTKDKDALSDLFDVMSTWFRDLLVYQFDPKRIVNKDLAEDIQRASREISVPSLFSKIKHIQNAQRHIQTNANLRLTLELLVVRLAKD